MMARLVPGKSRGWEDTPHWGKRAVALPRHLPHNAVTILVIVMIAMPNILSPRYDEVFKMLFGDEQNKDILAPFLKAALPLPEDDYEQIELLNPFLPGEVLDDKVGILDLRVRTKSGKLIDVEIQVANHSALKERVLYYLARLFTGQIGEGDSYRKLKPAIGVVITDFKWIGDSSSYHNDYRLRDLLSGSLFSEHLSLHTLELPKVSGVDDGTELWAWLEFLKAKDKEELEMLAKDHPTVEPAVKKLLRLSESEQAQILHESREKARRDEQARMQDAEESGWKEGLEKGLEKGLERGRKKGREEAQRAIARKALGEGLPLETVMAITGLSQAEVLGLQSEGQVRH
jgi:predicted transposase/invertase (TIGR01784 family)